MSKQVRQIQAVFKGTTDNILGYEYDKQYLLKISEGEDHPIKIELGDGNGGVKKPVEYSSIISFLNNWDCIIKK